MIDLDLINSKPIEIKFNGNMVKLNQPTFALSKKVRAFEKNVSQMQEEEIYKEQSDILLKFLNNNSSSKKFADKDIDSISFSGIKALYNALISAIVGIETDPN
ncbi:hypothetical protein [Clostridium sp. Marseille-Q2269]|uniref:hypothetical protein n=1 Tax=Clostridium sp. Marseille-Q2269 TaxID=2942205 RepID=UPI0020730443|nr:hypothetical protein [Clostridium sp. Marseille-Q2269]